MSSIANAMNYSVLYGNMCMAGLSTGHSPNNYEWCIMSRYSEKASVELH